MDISENFKLKEYFVSSDYPELAQKGYDQEKDNKETIRRIKHHAHTISQPLRDHVGSSVTLLSGYRDKYLNKAVGGSKTSDHMYGMAADLYIPSKLHNMDYMEDLFKWVIKNLNYRQAIWYPQTNSKFIHISINWVVENPEDKPFKKEAKVQFDGKYIFADEFFRKDYLHK